MAATANAPRTSAGGRPPWDAYFLSLASSAATRATCPRRHVGAVLVASDRRILSTGYNGAPAGSEHCADAGCLIDPDTGGCRRTRHAERNALDHASLWVPEGPMALYCTDAPCDECARDITRFTRPVPGGVITAVYYARRYRHEDGIERLRRHGIHAQHIPHPDIPE